MVFNINRFHFLVMLAWLFNIFFASQMIFPIFSNYIPQWRCATNEEFTSNCTIYLNCNQSIEFDQVIYHSSALEYGWICGKSAYYASLYSILQFIGVLLGTVTFGALSDEYGRRPITLFAFSMGILSVFISGLTPNWQTLLATRFLIGLWVGGVIVAGTTFVMEHLLPEQRMALRAIFNWGTGRLIMTVICYLLPDWRLSSYCCAVAALPGLLIMTFIFPESPTWLNSKGRIAAMCECEKRIAHFTRQPYVQREIREAEKMINLKAILKNPLYRKRLFVLWNMWFIASACGYAIDLNSSRISGNLFINQALFSVLIAGSKILIVAYDTLNAKFNRRKLHQYSQAAASTCFIVLGVIAMLPETKATLVIYLIGTVFIEYTWDACYLCAIESVPTSMRSSSLGSCSLFARFGALISPAVFYSATIWPSAPYFTVAFFGILCLITSCLFLDDTKGVVLDKVGEVETEMEPMMGEEGQKLNQS